MPDVKQLPVDQLRIDKRYQRPLDVLRVNRIVANFDERKLGVLEVSRRDGRIAVIDGQHRLAAIKEKGRKRALCLLHTDLSAKEEAELFVELQRERKNLRPHERFHASVFAGDKRSVEINRAVRRHDFEIGHTNSETPRIIEAVVSLERAWDWGGVGLVDDVLAFVNLAWRDDVGVNNGYFLQGVGLLLLEFGDRLSKDRVSKLAETPPMVIVRRALGYATYGGGGMGAKAITVELRKTAGLARNKPRAWRGKKYERLEWLTLNA